MSGETTEIHRFFVEIELVRRSDDHPDILFLKRDLLGGGFGEVDPDPRGRDEV